MYGHLPYSPSTLLKPSSPIQTCHLAIALHLISSAQHRTAHSSSPSLPLLDHSHVIFTFFYENKIKVKTSFISSLPDPTTLFTSIHFSPEELSYTSSLQPLPFSPSPEISQALTQLLLPVCVKVSRGPPLLHFKQQKLTEVTNSP